VAVASERKRGTVDGVVVARVCCCGIFMNATIKGFCRKVNDFNNRSVRINRPSKLERRTLMAKACVMEKLLRKGACGTKDIESFIAFP